MENKDKNNKKDAAAVVRARISHRSIVRRRRIGSAWRKALINGTNV